MDCPYTCLYPQVFLLGGIAGQRLLAEKEKIQNKGLRVARCSGAAMQRCSDDAASRRRCPHLIHSRSINPLLPCHKR